jgi:demethylmenaquinone methyltransferase/2-methoxy-6-polyprenyl-1,4-benzoquinol methylase
MMRENGQDRTSFGFREVEPREKAGLVRGVFDKVAPKYDLMNDLMSGGLHRVWKTILVDRLAPQAGETLLDLAGGTGDVAAAFLARADRRPAAARKAPARAIIADINAEMLKAGRLRERGDDLSRRLALLCADAENLPLPDQSVDALTIAFGIRNVTHVDRALSEARRVLKLGGRFFCLEFSHPATEAMQRLYDLYSFNVIPWLGEKVAGDRESYQYLVESIRRFPAQEAFAAMIGKAGLARVKYENLSAGVVAIHCGWRI